MKLTRKHLEKLIREELQKVTNEAVTSKGIDPFAAPRDLDAGPDGGMMDQEMLQKIHNALKNTKLGKMAVDANKVSLVGEAAAELVAILKSDDLSSGM